MIKRVVLNILFLPFYFLSDGVGIKKYLTVSRQPILIRSRWENVNIEADVKIGNPSSIDFFSPSYIETRGKLAKISIGQGTCIGNNVAFIATSEITIGKRCLIGNNVRIYDSDFHSLDISRSTARAISSPVKMGDNVFLGDNVILLKGVKIGENSIIGAGSVVTKSIPSNVIAAGNPARVLKKI
ncbi:acyltransferase [Marinobacter halophilus]|uniref:Acetyltransferase n=1 Tax=Marinobacter halophilus TaxID=1323740 RepID=A0A2T1KCD3_9GAMM|nr:DapH/DapD/GlmU-related protein [Marinobacter halophilus]PSF07765.1 acetyltransferase [Marinobacter halophilus]GGC56873.1 transferase [Marinobacter halophilus]